MVQDKVKILKISNLSENWPFLISGLCFSFILFNLPKLWQFVSAMIVLAVILVSLCIRNVFTVITESKMISRILSAAFALIIAVLSFKFCSGNESNRLSIVAIVVLLLLSMVFLTVLSCTIISEITRLCGRTFRYNSWTDAIHNIRSNAFILISAFVYIRMNFVPYFINFMSMFLSYIVLTVIFSQIPNVITRLKNIHVLIKIYAASSALGICYYSTMMFRAYVYDFPISGIIVESIGSDPGVTVVFSYVLALVAFLFVYTFVALILDHVIQKLKPLFCSLSKIEVAAYILMFAGLMALVCYAFMHSYLFWSGGYSCDLVYVFDTSDLIDPSAYFCLIHHQNDLKQPLFAVFAAPILGFGYFLSIPFTRVSPVIQPLFMNAIQIILLIVTFIMIAKMLKISSWERIFFVLAATVTYPSLLFSMVMEQYLVATFWFIFAIYTVIEHGKLEATAFSAASGSLLTGFSLLLLDDKKCSDGKISLRVYADSIAEKIAFFFVLLIGFGRSDVLLNSASSLSGLSSYTDSNNIIERLNQFLNFVSSLFVKPAAGPSIIYEHISWQLDKSNIYTTNIAGIIIIVLCILSFVINRKNKLTIVASLWIGFSFVLLCLVGWGSAENGMIIYALYFCWAYLVLLFQLLEWISTKIRFKAFTPIICLIASVVLAVMNYQGIRDLLNFAFTSFPFG